MRYDNIHPTYPNLARFAEVMFVLDQLPTAAERRLRDENEARIAATFLEGRKRKLMETIPPDLRPDNDR